MDIAEAGLRHLREALAGDLQSIEVPEWPGEDGKPLCIYFRPLIGAEQKQIEAMSSQSETQGVCMAVKVRALREDGSKAFGEVPIESLMHDFNYNALLRIFLRMVSGTPMAEQVQEMFEKE